MISKSILHSALGCLLICVAGLLLPQEGLAQTLQAVQHGSVGKLDPAHNPPSSSRLANEPTPMQLIPEGEFEMGDHSGIGWYDERPVHPVYIDVFYMDTFEVTNEEYCTYLNSAYSQDLIEVSGGVVFKKDGMEPYCDTTLKAYESRITWNGRVFGVSAGKKNHPMAKVSWYGAVAFANWRSAQEGLPLCYNLLTWECTFGVGGYRLPTEAEWEKAARGGEHSPYYEFPWGDSMDGSKANYHFSGDPYETGYFPWTTPVGYYDGNQNPSGVDMANGYGLYDMAGNALEWCNDWYDSAYYQYCVDNGIYHNPAGPWSSPLGYRVLRGGSWYSSEDQLRCADRNGYYAGGRLPLGELGFRLVREIP